MGLLGGEKVICWAVSVQYTTVMDRQTNVNPQYHWLESTLGWHARPLWWTVICSQARFDKLHTCRSIVFCCNTCSCPFYCRSMLCISVANDIVLCLSVCLQVLKWHFTIFLSFFVRFHFNVLAGIVSSEVHSLPNSLEFPLWRCLQCLFSYTRWLAHQEVAQPSCHCSYNSCVCKSIFVNRSQSSCRTQYIGCCKWAT